MEANLGDGGTLQINSACTPEGINISFLTFHFKLFFAVTNSRFLERQQKKDDGSQDAEAAVTRRKR